jgi:hypothetical protein
MRKGGVKGCLAWMSAVLMLPALVSCSHAARSAGASPWSSVPPAESQRIKVLTRALILMQREYSKLHESPGPQDVLDYQVGDLWKRGIDGAGTTVAVIEGWTSRIGLLSAAMRPSG